MVYTVNIIPLVMPLITVVILKVIREEMCSSEKEIHSQCPRGIIAPWAPGIKDWKVILFSFLFISEFSKCFEIYISFITLKIN